MRELKFPDVFSVIRIVKKAGISRQVRSIFAEMDDSTTQNEIGARFIFSIIENLAEAQEEITEFLASLQEVEKKEIENYSLEQTTEVLMDFLQHPELKSFFLSALKLMK